MKYLIPLIILALIAFLQVTILGEMIRDLKDLEERISTVEICLNSRFCKNSHE